MSYPETIPVNLRDDKTFIMEAVTQNPGLLALASERLRDDPEVVLEAWTYGKVSIKYASKRLLNDKVFSKHILTTWGQSLEYFSESIRADIDLVELAIYSSMRGSAFLFASPELQETEDLAKLFVEQDKDNYFKLSAEMASSRSILEDLLNRYPNYLEKLTAVQRKDLLLVTIALKSSGFSLNYVEQDLLDKHPELIMLAVSTTPAVYRDLTIEQQSDRKIIKKAILGDPYLIGEMGVVRDDDEMALLAMSLNSKILPNLSERLRFAMNYIEDLYHDYYFEAVDYLNGLPPEINSKFQRHLDKKPQSFFKEVTKAIYDDNFYWNPDNVNSVKIHDGIAHLASRLTEDTLNEIIEKQQHFAFTEMFSRALSDRKINKISQATSNKKKISRRTVS